MKWRCGTCDEEHDGLPMCWGAEAPWRALVPEEGFDERVRLNNDVCVVDDEHHFVRCLLQIDEGGADESFEWGVWCSLSRENIEHFAAIWDDPSREGQECFGWVCTELHTYAAPTLHLPATVLWRAPGLAPTVILHDGDHPLIDEQRGGISLQRVQDIAAELMH